MGEAMKGINIRPSVKHEMIRYIAMVIASISFALSLDLFIVPHHIVAGSLTGLSTLVQIIVKNNTGAVIGIGVLTICFDIPILLFGLKEYGWKFILRCLLTILVLGLITDVLAFLVEYDVAKNEPLMAAVYGGLLQGIAIGLYCKYDVSSGGTELLGKLVYDKTKRLSVPLYIGILDGIIVLSGSVVLQNAQNVLYALIVIFTSTIVSDTILTGLNKAKLCYIITDHADEISDCLLKNSPRGITGIKGMGMYTRSDKNILLTVVKKNQLEDLKRMIHMLDPLAFVIVSETNEVLGKGFKEIENYDKK